MNIPIPQDCKHPGLKMNKAIVIFLITWFRERGIWVDGKINLTLIKNVL
jgi:hypothetical protein